MAETIDAKSGDRVGVLLAVDDKEAPVYLGIFDCDTDTNAFAALTAEEATEVCRALADVVLAVAETA